MEIGLVLAGFVIGLLIRHFLASYLSEKGKNLATKEDVHQITQTVEGVKADFSKDLESLKLQLTKKANIHRLVAEREVAAIFEIGSSIFDLKIATGSLRPAFDKLPDDSQRRKELFAKRYDNWAEKHDLFLASVEKNRLFLPTQIYKRLLEIKQLAVKEGISFETDFRFSPGDGFSFEQYQKSNENINALIEAIEQLSGIINSRYEVEGLAS